jgi:Tfp pilus assembly protein PilE
MVESSRRPGFGTTRSRRGFTFVELLVTLLFITVLMPTAMRGISLCTNIAGESRRKVEAATLAKTQLTELIVTGDLQNGARSGDFGNEWPGYKWTADVSNWTEASNVSVRQVDVTVTWLSGGTTKKLTLSTLVYQEGQS